MRPEGKTAETERPPATLIAVKIGTAYNCSVLTVVNIYADLPAKCGTRRPAESQRRQGARSLGIVETSA